MVFLDADQRLARNDQSSGYPSSRSGEGRTEIKEMQFYF